MKPRSADDIYREILSISARIDALEPESRDRKKLEASRDRLRDEAANLAVAGRHPASVELQIETIEQRLAQIEAMQIKEGYQEKRGGRNIQDPGAYSANINRLLSDQHADEVKALTEQLERLRRRVETDDGREPGTR